MRSRAPRTGFSPRPLRDPFADRASLLIRVLLEQPGAEWSVRGLAEAAGVTPMLSSDVVRQLAESQVVTTRPSGRKLSVRLRDPALLLERWTSAYRWNKNVAVTVAAPVIDTERFLGRLPRTFAARRWALTLLAGAWQRIRFAPTERLHVYVESTDARDLRTIADEAGWPEDPTGRVVLMKPWYRDAVWHGVVRPDTRTAPVVSDLQLIVDLWHYPERGQEVAKQLWRPFLRRHAEAARRDRLREP